ncbi:hypothetical protein GGR54DRAFT_476670 [Hypoxylon sp. NC1633]|nr:hypothetical protein GGR54DRAFT_476670 [Hypoxylon sp. NC1633]
MAPLGKYALIAVFAGLSAFGFRATIIPMSYNGLGKLLRNVAAPGAGATAELLVAPTPFKREYTGLAALDRQLALLVAFFAGLIDDEGAGWETTAYYVWALAQFAAAWTVLVLEGRRSGSRGRAVSWVGLTGFLFQNMTWTFTVPLYLALHLLTSPAARLGAAASANGKELGDAARRSLFVYLWDLALLPMAVTLGFIVPTAFMSLPWVLHQSAATHYNWIALWQFFPLLTVVILDVLHNACYYLLGSLSPQDAQGQPTTPGNAFAVAVAGVYEFGLTMCAATHVPILALSLLPDSLRSSVAAVFPKLAPVVSQVTFARTFVPHPLSPPLTVDPAAYGPGDLAPMAINFLQYDIYTGNLALLLWALYLHFTTTGRDPARTFGKTAFWTLVAGPIGAALALLWDRDEVVRLGEGEGVEAKTK